MKSLIYGGLQFGRNSIPDQLRDLSTWPTIDVTALSPENQQSFSANQEAIRIFVDSPLTHMSTIAKLTGVHPQPLYRLFQRCVTTHADGRIYGFRAAIPYARMKEYERIQPVNSQGQSAGSAGAFTLLLRQYPSVEKALKRAIRERNKTITTAREVRKSLKNIHKMLLVECRHAGIKANEYPFTHAMLGIRSLSSYIKKQVAANFDTAAREAGASRSSPSVSTSGLPIRSATQAFEIVEFDGHKIDLRITLRIKNPFGLETIMELNRIWILVLLDVATRCVIGYALALGKEYNKDDVASALQAALTPFKPRVYRIPGLKIRDGGGFPSAVIPQTQFACWDWFRFDGARAHVATDTVDRLTKIVGCWTDNGPAGEPDARPFIERFFDLIARHFAHRLPGTTGSDPKAIVRKLADPKSDLSLLVELSELEEMIEVLIGDYNGESHDGLGGRTPLEAMTYMIEKQRGFLRTLPQMMRANLCLLQEVRIAKIVGSAASATRPYVNFAGVRYSSDVLSSNAALVGKMLRIYFDVRDIRVLRAFFEDGSELGILTAARPWCYTPHSLRVRQEIMKLKRQGKLVYRDGDDPVEAWVNYKHAQSRRSKRAANDLAKMQKIAPQVIEALPFPEPPLPPSVKPVAKSDEEVTSQDSEQGKAERTPPEQENKPLADKELPQPRTLKIKRTMTF